MSRSERYIPPSEEELQRMQQSIEAAERFDHQRKELLRTALKRLKKADLVELTLRVAGEDKASEWLLEKEVGLNKPVDLLVHDIRIAVKMATQVDERELNRNPEIDWRAYEAVHRGLCQLIEKGELEEAKAMAVRLMDKGSFQVECSDEGLMYEEIESCLRPLISAVAESPGGGQWALEMLQHDRVGFICSQELADLAKLKRD